MSGYKIPVISIIYDDNYQNAVVTNNHVCDLLADVFKRLHIAHRLTQDDQGVKNIDIEAKVEAEKEKLIDDWFGV